MQEGQVVKNALRRLILPEMAPALHASLVLDSEFRLAKALIQVSLLIYVIITDHSVVSSGQWFLR